MTHYKVGRRNGIQIILDGTLIQMGGAEENDLRGQKLIFFFIMFSSQIISQYHYREKDKLSMLRNCAGLSDKPLCEWLMLLHEKLQTLVLSKKSPVLGDLLQAGQLIAHLQERGFSCAEAVSHATSDVYLTLCKKRGDSLEEVRLLIK